MSKLTRNQFISKLVEEGRTEDEVIEALLKGDEESGVKPVSADSETKARNFAKMIYKKYVKSN